jgi:hypothetical protein
MVEHGSAIYRSLTVEFMTMNNTCRLVSWAELL